MAVVNQIWKGSGIWANLLNLQGVMQLTRLQSQKMLVLFQQQSNFVPAHAPPEVLLPSILMCRQNISTNYPQAGILSQPAYATPAAKVKISLLQQ